MGLLDKVLGAGGIAEAFRAIVGTWKMPPEAKLAFDKALAENAHELALKDRELEAKLAEYASKEVEVASANIRAETSSGDTYTSRARPTFLYVMMGVYVNNYVLLPWASRAPIDFPEALHWLFGSAILGYTGARSWEKIMAKGYK